MDSADLESGQAENHSPERRRLTEEELSWLKENGGGGEGIVLSIVPVYVNPSMPKDVATGWGPKEADPNYVEFRVGEKTIMPPQGLLATSLFNLTDPDSKENWPHFLLPSMLTTALVGLHYNDFQHIVEFVNPVDKRLGQLGVRAKALSILDLLTIRVPCEPSENFFYYKESKRLPHLPGRQIAVETTLGGLRILKVAEDWQERLRRTRPFELRKWKEVLDVIEEK